MWTILTFLITKLNPLRDRCKMTERCKECGIFAGAEYGTDTFNLNDIIYCSLNCFYERDKKLRETKNNKVEKPIVKKKKVKKRKK